MNLKRLNRFIPAIKSSNILPESANNVTLKTQCWVLNDITIKEPQRWKVWEFQLTITWWYERMQAKKHAIGMHIKQIKQHIGTASVGVASFILHFTKACRADVPFLQVQYQRGCSYGYIKPLDTLTFLLFNSQICARCCPSHGNQARLTRASARGKQAGGLLGY